MSQIVPDEFSNYHAGLYENRELRITQTKIPGLLVIDLVLHGDERGWFKESFQREKLVSLGFPADFKIVQNNVSSNREAGVTRGIHAEPWNKCITLTRGLVYVAIVDLREGEHFGTVEQFTLTPGQALYVPKGCGNSYQTLTPDVEYSYLVDAHWSPHAEYTYVNLADPSLGIQWPIPLTKAILSDKDNKHPMLSEITPLKFLTANTKRMLITGAGGQLGKALRAHYKDAHALRSDELDISDPKAVAAYDWSGVDVIINAAAYTNVDAAQTPEGRAAAWKVNALGARNLAQAAIAHDLTLVHISTDYVFDGTAHEYSEQSELTPLGAYGQSKAAGDIAVNLVPKHYLLRTSWVVGDGKNFVRTMLGLGQKGIAPTVVADQIGRLTFTTELVRIIDHLLSTNAQYGTYNASNSGDAVSWADVARTVFELAGYDLRVAETTTAAYFADKLDAAPRPLSSRLDLTKLWSTGFEGRDWRDDLRHYVAAELAQ